MRVHGQAELVLQIAVAGPAQDRAEEQLTIRRDGVPVSATEVDMGHGGRARLLRLAPGLVTIDYSAVVSGVATRPEPTQS